MYGDRLNQIDLRFTKIVNVGHGRIDLNVDFYNAFNSDAVIGELGAFGPAWRLPLTVIQPRFVKFAGAVRFLAERRQFPTPNFQLPTSNLGSWELELRSSSRHLAPSPPPN